MGVGEAVADRKVLDAAIGDLTKITGQALHREKSVASFKVRENRPSAAGVTARRECTGFSIA